MAGNFLPTKWLSASQETLLHVLPHTQENAVDLHSVSSSLLVTNNLSPAQTIAMVNCKLHGAESFLGSYPVFS